MNTAGRRRASTLLPATLVAGALALSCSGGDVTGPSIADVARVTITPGEMTLDAIGATTRLQVAVSNASGGPLAFAAQWRSTAGDIATVDTAGTVTAVRNGSALVVAQVGAVADTATVLVAQAPATARMTASVTDTIRSLGDTISFAVELLDRLGHSVVGAAVICTTNRPTVLQAVGEVCQFVSVGSGDAIARASAGGAVAESTVHVRQRATSLNFTLPQVTLSVRQVRQLVLDGRDARGNVLGPGAVTLVSRNVNWVRLAADAVVGVLPGRTWVVASSGDLRDSITVEVERTGTSQPYQVTSPRGQVYGIERIGRMSDGTSIALAPAQDRPPYYQVWSYHGAGWTRMTGGPFATAVASHGCSTLAQASSGPLYVGCFNRIYRERGGALEDVGPVPSKGGLINSIYGLTIRSGSPDTLYATINIGGVTVLRRPVSAASWEIVTAESSIYDVDIFGMLDPLVTADGYVYVGGIECIQVGPMAFGCTNPVTLEYDLSKGTSGAWASLPWHPEKKHDLVGAVMDSTYGVVFLDSHGDLASKKDGQFLEWSTDVSPLGEVSRITGSNLLLRLRGGDLVAPRAESTEESLAIRFRRIREASIEDAGALPAVCCYASLSVGEGADGEVLVGEYTTGVVGARLTHDWRRLDQRLVDHMLYASAFVEDEGILLGAASLTPVKSNMPLATVPLPLFPRAAWAAGPREYYIVGQSSQRTPTRLSAMRWDGVAVEDLGLPSREGVLLSVFGSEMGRIWAVGTDDANRTFPCTGGERHPRMVAYLFDGVEWKDVSPPYEGELHDVWAGGHDRVYAVGCVYQGSAESAPAFLEWSGGGWRLSDPSRGLASALYSVRGFSGALFVGGQEGSYPLLLRSQDSGATWVTVPRPTTVLPGVGYFGAITSLAGSDPDHLVGLIGSAGWCGDPYWLREGGWRSPLLEGSSHCFWRANASGAVPVYVGRGGSFAYGYPDEVSPSLSIVGRGSPMGDSAPYAWWRGVAAGGMPVIRVGTREYFLLDDTPHR